jgi:hypothetical protein
VSKRIQLTRFRFYFVDERKEDASPAFLIDGRAHAEEFYKLTTRPDQGPWEHTFAAGKGYVNFEGRIGTMPDLKPLEERQAEAESK